MKFPKLFKYTSLGQIQSWQIFTSGNLYWTEEGIHILTKSEPTECTGKNIGKKNETTDQEQAVIEAVANGSIIGTGQGRTKKAAEQQAAYEAILLLKEKSIP